MRYLKTALRIAAVAAFAFAVIMPASYALLSVFVGDRSAFIDMAVHKDGMQKLEASRQLNARYGEVDNFIVHFGFTKQPLEWHTVAFVDGRFTLTFVQPVAVDYSKKSVAPAGDAKFYLHAAESIRMLDGDRAETTYDGTLQREFGKAEWDKFVASDFDLTILGIPRDEIHPLPLWKEAVHGQRKDRVVIK